MASKNRTSTPPRPKPIEVGQVRASTMNRWRERDGQITWYWRARRKTERDVVWSGWGTRDEIQERIAALVTDGVPMKETKDAPREIRTLGDLMDHWTHGQIERPDLSPHTIDHYLKCARHIAAWLRDVDCHRMDRRTVERYRDCRLRENASRRLVLQELRIFGMAWRWGQECALVPDRAMPRVQLTIEGYVINHRTPSPVELGQVLEHLSGDAHLAVLLLAVTDARISEVCELRRRDFDKRTGDLALVGKTGPRTFPLPYDVAMLLADRASASDEPMLKIGKRTPDESLRDKLARACKAAKVEPFTPHGLRRMVVDRMARSGVDVATSASLTGHSPEVMLSFYRQVSPDDRRKAVALAGLGSFPGVAEGKVVRGPWGG